MAISKQLEHADFMSARSFIEICIYNCKLQSHFWFKDLENQAKSIVKYIIWVAI